MKKKRPGPDFQFRVAKFLKCRNCVSDYDSSKTEHCEVFEPGIPEGQALLSWCWNSEIEDFTFKELVPLNQSSRLTLHLHGFAQYQVMRPGRDKLVFQELYKSTELTGRA